MATTIKKTPAKPTRLGTVVASGLPGGGKSNVPRAQNPAYHASKPTAAKPKAAAPKASLVSRIATDPALRQRVLANVGLRTQLPDSVLGKYAPDLLKKRTAVRVQKELGDVDTPLSGQSLTDTARVLTDSSYKPLYQDLDKQGTQVTGREAQQSRFAQDYTKQAEGSIQAALNAQIQANAHARQAQDAITSDTNSAIDKATADAQAALGQDAAVRGAGLDGGSAAKLAADMAAAKGRAANEGATNAANAEAIGANYAGFLNASQGVNQVRGQESQAGVRANANGALAELAAQRSKLQESEKGDYTDTVLKLRSSEGDRALAQKTLASKEDQALMDARLEARRIDSQEGIAQANRRLQVTLKGMGIDAATAKQKADQIFTAHQNRLGREATADNSEAGRKAAAKEKEKDREAAVKLAKLKAKLKGSGGAGSFTPAQVRGYKNALQSAEASAATIKPSVDSKETTSTDAITYLTGEVHNNLAARIAYIRIVEKHKIPFSIRKQAVEQLGFDPGP